MEKGLAPINWNENVRQCTATSKRTGERCKCPAVTGYDVCNVHGAHKRKPGDPPRKTTSGRGSRVFKDYKKKIKETAAELGIELPKDLKHGFLGFKILEENEREEFLAIVNRLHDDFEMNKSSDFYATELVATCLIMFRRAMKNGDMKTIEGYDRMVRMHLSDLKATKSAREGDTVNIKTTPAEWAASILKRIEEEEALEQAGPAGAFSEESKNSVAFDKGDDANKSDETKTIDKQSVAFDEVSDGAGDVRVSGTEPLTSPQKHT